MLWSCVGLQTSQNPIPMMTVRPSVTKRWAWERIDKIFADMNIQISGATGGSLRLFCKEPLKTR